MQAHSDELIVPDVLVLLSFEKFVSLWVPLTRLFLIFVAFREGTPASKLCWSVSP